MTVLRALWNEGELIKRHVTNMVYCIIHLPRAMATTSNYCRVRQAYTYYCQGRTIGLPPYGAGYWPARMG